MPTFCDRYLAPNSDFLAGRSWEAVGMTGVNGSLVTQPRPLQASGECLSLSLFQIIFLPLKRSALHCHFILHFFGVGGLSELSIRQKKAISHVLSYV